MFSEDALLDQLVLKALQIPQSEAALPLRFVLMDPEISMQLRVVVTGPAVLLPIDLDILEQKAEITPVVPISLQRSTPKTSEPRAGRGGRRVRGQSPFRR